MGCCLFAVLLAGAPRLAFIIWWIFDQARMMVTFKGNWFLPLLGLIFVPWTTVMYVIVYPGGINGFDWVWLGLALAVDIGTYVGNGRARQMQTAS